VYCVAVSCAVGSVGNNKVVDLAHIETAVKVSLANLQMLRELIASSY
jgi:hypothetical protein